MAITLQGLMQDYQSLVLQEGESDMFQYFSTILHVHFRNSREGKSTSGVGNSYAPYPLNNSTPHTSYPTPYTSHLTSIPHAVTTPDSPYPMLYLTLHTQNPTPHTPHPTPHISLAYLTPRPPDSPHPIPNMLYLTQHTLFPTPHI